MTIHTGHTYKITNVKGGTVVDLSGGDNKSSKWLSYWYICQHDADLFFFLPCSHRGKSCRLISLVAEIPMKTQYDNHGGPNQKVSLLSYTQSVKTCSITCAVGVRLPRIRLVDQVSRIRWISRDRERSRRRSAARRSGL